jgi:hypothetical protein
VYPDIQTILMEFPAGMATQANVTHILKISQLRHAAYSFTTPYSIHYVAMKTHYRTFECDIVNLPPPTVAPPISLLMSTTSTFSADVYVTYNFSFTPSYFVPKGSKIKIDLPARGSLNYNHLGSSTPPAICSISDDTLLDPCVISATSLTVIAAEDIAENTPLTISVTGAKNPTFVGPTISSDFGLTIIHPNTFLINQ